jgi:TatD DNase family protein
LTGEHLAAGAGPTWVDSHCHVHSVSGEPAEVLARARAAGVVGLVCVGTDLASSRLAAELAAAERDVRATAGLHPHDARRFEEEWDDLAPLMEHPLVVAVGETGLDFHYLLSPADAQDVAFRAHVRAAHRLDKTLVVHSRDAWDDTFRILDDEGVPRRTVFHCFTGGVSEARRALDRDAYLSFSGIVSFRNADDVRAAAALVPPERLLVETDAPYLAPVPHRGRENEPAFVSAVGEALAAATGRAVDDLALVTRQNASQLFGKFSTAS